jgi:spermidine/putrescine transport system permease protein
MLCLLIAYPSPTTPRVRRAAGRGLLLAALIAPFWISYMMRMLAWVNLLQTDGARHKALSHGRALDVHVELAAGGPATVVLGLVYGYVPYMILPLYAGLDRRPQRCSRPPATSAPAGGRRSAGSPGR